MRISVVIPARNESELLPLCLKSLVEQDETPYEIIVVDNDSTDDTADIARSFGVTVLREPTRGISYARNRGFDAASGDIIARCDADSILFPDWTTQLRQTFEQRDVDAVTGPTMMYDYPHPYFAAWIIRQTFHKNGRWMLGAPMLFGSNMAITRAAWQRIRKDACLEWQRLHEDVDLGLHLVRAGGKVFYDDRLVELTSARRALNLYNGIVYLGRTYWTCLSHGVPIYLTWLSRWPDGEKAS